MKCPPHAIVKECCGQLHGTIIASRSCASSNPAGYINWEYQSSAESEFRIDDCSPRVGLHERLGGIAEIYGGPTVSVRIHRYLLVQELMNQTRHIHNVVMGGMNCGWRWAEIRVSRRESEKC